MRALLDFYSSYYWAYELDFVPLISRVMYSLASLSLLTDSHLERFWYSNSVLNCAYLF